MWAPSRRWRCLDPFAADEAASGLEIHGGPDDKGA